MKKILVSGLILILFAGTLFYIGWVQFAVPAGKYGVLQSKSGGIDPKTIIPAQFCWKWERLIPTNSQLIIFDLVPTDRKISIEGQLPSGDIYSKMLEGNPDFSWKMDVSVTARVFPSFLPELVGQFHIKDQAALEEWTVSALAGLMEGAVRSIIADAMLNPEEFRDFAADPVKLASLLQKKIAASEQQKLEIISVAPGMVKIPDFSVYALASATYTDYQKRRGILLSQAAAAEAKDAVAEYLEIERFARLGEVLTKYPILIDYLSVSRGVETDSFKAVKSIR